MAVFDQFFGSSRFPKINYHNCIFGQIFDDSVRKIELVTTYVIHAKLLHGFITVDLQYYTKVTPTYIQHAVASPLATRPISRLAAVACSGALCRQSLGCTVYALCYLESPFDRAYQRGDSIALAVLGANVHLPETPM